MSAAEARGAAGAPYDDLTCAEFVELVTDYLEGALDPSTTLRFEEHARACPGCEVYLDQMRQTIQEVGRVTEESLAPDVRDRLLAAFRDWGRPPRA